VQVELDLAEAAEDARAQRPDAAGVWVVVAVEPGVLWRPAVGVAVTARQLFIGGAPGADRRFRGVITEALRRLEMVGAEHHHVDRPIRGKAAAVEAAVATQVRPQPAAAQELPARRA